MNISKQNIPGAQDAVVRMAYNAASDVLELVENKIKETLVSDASRLSEISHYLLDLGGKRLRPVLAILSAKLFGMKTPSPELIIAAAGVELIHMATLLHDDIIDNSPMRRKRQSAFAKYGMSSTLLAGDFLLVRAFGLCAHLEKDVIADTEAACIELTEGEELEGVIDPQNPPSIEQYLTIIGKKTASLFQLCTAMGAHINKVDKTALELSKTFGLEMGRAFQMIDDILDVTADENLLGKPAGTDLKQKTPSLVNLLWLRSGDSKARDFFSVPQPTIEQAREMVIYLKQSSILIEARTFAESYANKSLAALDALKQYNIDDKIRGYLESVVKYTLSRCM